MSLLSFITFLVVASCSAAPSSNNRIISKEFFLNKPILYSGQHDIVKIYVPSNQFAYKESEETKNHYVIFFVEADLEGGQRTDQGLYVYKNDQATKLLDHGRDVVTTHENITYFGANDGIYKYDEEGDKAVKVGTVIDNIIQLAYNNKTNDIYYLTENHEFFKLSKDATSSVKVANVKDAMKVVFGFEGNLYNSDSDKNVYVLDTQVDGGVPKKVEGLPSGNNLILLPPLLELESGALVIVDGSIYFLEPKATVYKSFVKLTFKPTAGAPQPTMVQFFAIDKKIYQMDDVISLIDQ